MAFDKPQSRNEAILQNMLGANNELEPPKSRVEALLQDIAGKMPEANPSEGTTTGTLERLKIGDDIYTVEGGGSGTSDYDALNNKPQIAGVTLSGDKSLADLGIASATTVSGILDGTDIDSFGDVETALGAIQDGQSIDSFADVETAISGIKDGTTIDSFADVESAIGTIEDGTTIDSFADVESALALKQDATDNSLDTEDKTIVGAINENAGDISSLKSGLTNVQSDVKLNTQDLTTPSRSINLMTLPITITKSGGSTGTVTNNNGVITLNGEFLENEVITITCANCIAPNDAIIAYMNNVALPSANISFYDGSTKHDYFSLSIPNRVIYTSALVSVVGKTINRYDMTFTANATLEDFTFSLMMVHNGQNVSTFAPYIPSVESRIEAVESGLIDLDKVILRNITANQNTDVTIGSGSDIYTVPADAWYCLEISANNGMSTVLNVNGYGIFSVSGGKNTASLPFKAGTKLSYWCSGGASGGSAKAQIMYLI